jgi:hypothetical protein
LRWQPHVVCEVLRLWPEANSRYAGRVFL